MHYLFWGLGVAAVIASGLFMHMYSVLQVI